jgi:site-specific recombinase XerD
MYREAVRQFSAFCAENGIVDLAQVEPVHVAAFVEMQLKTQSKPTVKLRLAALRMLFDWMVVGQVTVCSKRATLNCRSNWRLLHFSWTAMRK